MEFLLCSRDWRFKGFFGKVCGDGDGDVIVEQGSRVQDSFKVQELMMFIIFNRTVNMEIVRLVKVQCVVFFQGVGFVVSMGKILVLYKLCINGICFNFSIWAI